MEENNNLELNINENSTDIKSSRIQNTKKLNPNKVPVYDLIT